MHRSIALLAAVLLGAFCVHAAPSEKQKETFLSGFRMAVAANNPAMLTSLLYSEGVSQENIRNTQNGAFRRLLDKLQPFKNDLSYEWSDAATSKEPATKVVNGIRYTTTSSPATYLEIRSGGAVITGFFLCEEYGKLLLIGTMTEPAPGR
ncbi:MAG: hypothetical protein BGO12_03670 [Verrucomicrobia bacterium 61-8]|nr:hypothetical protein [Verrucomicrobiota bacterium]OJV11765.1 MAG: hypothetical protein BGO12_03670 [Verrucomicrobia bacterium 61-8]